MFQKLQAWQDEHDINDEALAQKVGVNRTTIWRAKRGLRVLGMDIQLKIQKTTRISPADWAEFYAQTVALRPRISKKNGVERRGAA